MRTNCRHYESRSYPNGETVRKCNLDLAPEAPWRCPDNCPSYTPRRLDVGWVHGSLGVRDFAEDPPNLGDDSIAALLDEAEEIVNSAGSDILAEVEAERSRKTGPLRRLSSKARAKARRKRRKR
jgi:hypothetical protein